MVDAIHRILADSALNFNFRPEQLDVIESVLLQHLRHGCDPVSRRGKQPGADGTFRCGSPEPDLSGILNVYISAHCPKGVPGSAGGWAAVFENGASLWGGVLAGADAIALNIIATTSAVRAVINQPGETDAPGFILRVHSDHRGFVASAIADGKSADDHANLWADLRAVTSGCAAQFVNIDMHKLAANPGANDAWALAHDAGRRFLKIARHAA